MHSVQIYTEKPNLPVLPLPWRDEHFTFFNSLLSRGYFALARPLQVPLHAHVLRIHPRGAVKIRPTQRHLARPQTHSSLCPVGWTRPRPSALIFWGCRHRFLHHLLSGLYGVRFATVLRCAPHQALQVRQPLSVLLSSCCFPPATSSL
jgi:hypothetical protein